MIRFIKNHRVAPRAKPMIHHRRFRMPGALQIKKAPQLIKRSFSSSSLSSKGFQTYLESKPEESLSRLEGQLCFPRDFAPSKKIVVKDSIFDLPSYTHFRKKLGHLRRYVKDHRRVLVGPNASVLFFNYDIISEMLFVEKGGNEQLTDELQAYNPLIPQGSELTFSFMLEFPNKVRRVQALKQLFGVEQTIKLKIDQHPPIVAVDANPELADARVDHHGKTSSVHYLKFPLSPIQQNQFLNASEVSLSVDHESYPHSAKFSLVVLDSLKKDFNI